MMQEHFESKLRSLRHGSLDSDLDMSSSSEEEEEDSSSSDEGGDDVDDDDDDDEGTEEDLSAGDAGSSEDGLDMDGRSALGRRIRWCGFPPDRCCWVCGLKSRLEWH